MSNKKSNTTAAATPPRSAKSMRWFLILNIGVAIALISGAVLLKHGANRYEPRAKFDRPYIAITKYEKDPAALHKGLVYTEGARAQAYRSVLNLSHGTSIIWLIVAVAFIANTYYLLRINVEQKKQLAAFQSA